MPKTTGHILKRDEVKLEGRFCLDIAQLQSQTSGLKEKSPDLSAPQVRIVEKNPEFADIEITCSCGIKTRLKCEYAGTRVPEGSIMQNGRADDPELEADNNQINGEKQNEE